MSIHSSVIAALGAGPWLLEGQGRMEQTLALAFLETVSLLFPILGCTTNLLCHLGTEPAAQE